ncbi:MAG: glycosyltransferase family 39 protein, partial [Thermoleophilia bacterium]|nr:glycosyltransferase family 39 protein [Thermoleophilia bacterium]
MPPPRAEPDPADGGALTATRPSALASLVERSDLAAVGVAGALLVSVGVLLARIVPDVRGKPLFDDEVLAALTAIHPFRELVEIVVSDRGGAPLHFALAHVALLLDPSPDALRWLSVVFAVAALPLCYDLGRRLGGRMAGSVAALVAGTSSMLAVYGSIGRMYALFAFVSALAADLFVRALERRTPGAVYAAAASAWLLPAVHPYGLVVVTVEAAVALALWRGRPLRPALPVLALLPLLTPFVLASLRLGERFGVTPSAGEPVAPPDFAARQLGEALAAFAGGQGALAALFFGLALAGLFVVARRVPPFAALAVGALAAIPILMVLARAQEGLVHLMSPRHLMYGLPLWAALVGVGVARVVRDVPRPLAALAVAGVSVAALLAPSGIPDPRVDASATRAALAAPAGWVRGHAGRDAVLLFYSPVYAEA